jgi:hypothetical protein
MMPGRNSASLAGSLTIPAVRISDGAGAGGGGDWMTGRGFIARLSHGCNEK